MKKVKLLSLALIFVLSCSVSLAGPPEVIPKTEMKKETVKPVLFTTPVTDEIVITCQALPCDVVIVTEPARQKVDVSDNAPALGAILLTTKSYACNDPVRHGNDINTGPPNTEIITDETNYERDESTFYIAFERKHYLYWQGNI